MNKFLDIEQLANAFSVEFSEKFYEKIDNKTIIQMLKMPLSWQNYTEEYGKKLSQLLSTTNPARSKQIYDFAEEIRLLTESIDCIPQLESLSKLFIKFKKFINPSLNMNYQKNRI